MVKLMLDVPAITLRYFDCRGRVQYFRYYLKLRGIAFIDSRISLKEGFAAWQQIKHDQRQTGPFLKLPVLHWGSQQIAESSVIRDWLHRKLGDEAKLSEQDNLQHAMLASSCCSELMTPIALLLWQEVMHPGSDLGGAGRTTLKRVSDHLLVLENTLQQWQWFDKLLHRPLMLTDCLLWEELSVVDKVFAGLIDWKPLPNLRHFYDHCLSAPLFRQMLEEHQEPITGRPNEAEGLLRVQAAIASHMATNA